MEQQQAKKWFINCIVLLASVLLAIAVLVVVIDPYFHYHKPFSFLSYRLFEERYVNDGISRHFDYDAMITGTSMTQNFKTSEMDALFGTNAVKAPFSGAGYQELSNHLIRALQRNEKLKTVVWAIDYNGLLRDYDWAKYDEYPTYLYDNNLLNDAPYLLNKSILYHGVLSSLEMTISGKPRTTMDEYSSWQYETGLEHILSSYDRTGLEPVSEQEFGKAEREKVTQTIDENIVQLVNQYPNTTFYLFYTPYSICYWDALHLKGTLNKQIEAEQTATELLLQCSNVRLFNFFDHSELICDLNYYNDDGHYSAEGNSMILQWMAAEIGLITQENYLDRLQQEKMFFLNYDYDAVFE